MIKTFIEAIIAYFSSFKLISQLKLWKFFRIPILISLAVGLLIAFLSFIFSDDIGEVIVRLWIWEWGKETFTTIGTFLGGFIVLLIGFILYKHIVMALASPFMSLVSERIENYYLEKHNDKKIKHLHRKTSFNHQLVRGIRINLRNLVRELFLTAIIFPFSFVPVLNWITTPLLFLVQSYYAGFGNMDCTLERHFNYKESVKFVKNNRSIAIGNGIVFMLLLLVPVVGFIIVLPLSVTASSVKTVECLYATKK